jgi:hypothetical protein
VADERGELAAHLVAHLGETFARARHAELAVRRLAARRPHRAGAAGLHRRRAPLGYSGEPRQRGHAAAASLLAWLR